MGQPRILVVDVETTGLDERICAIIEIGAQWLTTARAGEEFSVRCRPFEGAYIDPEAMAINGADWMDDPTVASEAAAIDAFLDWAGEGDIILAGMNPRYDLEMLRAAHHRAVTGLPPMAHPPFPFPHRTVDLHTLAVTWAMAAGEVVPERGLHTDLILTLLGLPEEPKPHRALNGARAEAEALRVLMGIPNTLAEVAL